MWFVTNRYSTTLFKKVKDGSHEFCAVLNFEAFPGKFVFKNIGKNSEKGWVPTAFIDFFKQFEWIINFRVQARPI